MRELQMPGTSKRKNTDQTNQNSESDQKKKMWLTASSFDPDKDQVHSYPGKCSLLKSKVQKRADWHWSVNFNQPKIALWNLEKFAESLLPLINDDSKVAIKIANEVLKEFPEKYKKKWLEMMKKKLGLVGDDPKDEQLIIELLSWMHQNKAESIKNKRN